MTASTPNERRSGSLAGRLRSLSRYDLVLAVIPTLLTVAVVGSELLSVPLHLLMSAATVVCALTLFDVLFVNPPGRGSAPR